LKENAYNLFLYVEKTRVKELGVAVHELDGSDAEKLVVLQSRVNHDYKSAKRYRLSVPLEWSEYQGRMRLGSHLAVFEGIFRDCHAPAQPLCAITPIVDGMPRILAVTNLGPLNLDDLKNTPLSRPGAMVDYLKAYVHDGGFDLPRLINDDYFNAIKLLFNAGHYVSCAKLLMSFIDSVAFIDLGDAPRNFVKWLEQYAALTPLGVTAEELWEFRNGLLHMTNLSSRSVVKGATPPLIMYVGNVPQGFRGSAHVEKYFNLKQLLDLVADAVSKWTATYNTSPDKFIEFVTRYDLTISDSRLAVVRY
jgi:hypothetical protein